MIKYIYKFEIYMKIAVTVLETSYDIALDNERKVEVWQILNFRRLFY